VEQKTWTIRQEEEKKELLCGWLTQKDVKRIKI
jgi:hypothetical protein